MPTPRVRARWTEVSLSTRRAGRQPGSHDAAFASGAHDSDDGTDQEVKNARGEREASHEPGNPLNACGGCHVGFAAPYAHARAKIHTCATRCPQQRNPNTRHSPILPAR